MERLSIKCHGYLRLTENQEDDLQRFGVHVFDRSSKNEDLPIYGIVKDLVFNSSPFEPRMVPRMIKDVHDYHKYGIFVGDIREENYSNGIIFDLSRAKTVPHPELTPDVVDKLTYLGYPHEVPHLDDERMDRMIDNWNYNHRKEHRFIWQRMGPNYELRKRLRTTNKVGLAVRYLHPKFRPEFFDWKTLKPITKTTMEIVHREWHNHWSGNHFYKGKVQTKELGEKLAEEHIRLTNRWVSGCDT